MRFVEDDDVVVAEQSTGGGDIESVKMGIDDDNVDLDSAGPLPAAMAIVGAINEDGLGPVNWWPDDEEDVDPAGAPMGEEGASL